jgi:hypothetical protein
MVLADMLCLQDFLDGLSHQELADVWRHIKLPPQVKQAAS